MIDLSSDRVVQAALQRILALKKKDQALNLQAATVKADLGEQFLKIRDRFAWKRAKGWERFLEKETEYQPRSVRNYIALHEFRRKLGNRFPNFARRFDISELYLLANQPDPVLDQLATAKKVTVAGVDVPIDDLTRRQLDRWLDDGPAHGVPRRRASLNPDPVPTAKDREAFARAFEAELRALAAKAPQIHGLPGKLTPDAKFDSQSALKALDLLLKKWPAWAKDGGS